ncbi:MAG TPA: energy transducer TonB, partial [Candidatus Eisenbacteria bacterium]|nr:energy transducer TonB [Candidatus Eisenbacteria bacterium]
GKLHNVLARYKQANPESLARTGTLVDSQGFRLEEFVAPIYPKLAVQAHIEGRVTLSLAINRTTGQVDNAEAVDGHVMLVSGAIKSAKHWRFDHSDTLPEKITAVLDFSFKCAN